MMDLLSESGSDQSSNQENDTLKINNAFAERYEYSERRKLLEKGKLKYGDNLDAGKSADEDESSSSEDDSDAELLNPTVEKKFLEVMTAIRKNDPKLKMAETNFFDDEDFDADGDQRRTNEGKNSKRMTLKDQIREDALKKMDKDSGSSSDEDSEEDEEEG